jgi:hypothetical protein
MGSDSSWVDITAPVSYSKSWRRTIYEQTQYEEQTNELTLNEL